MIKDKCVPRDEVQELYVQSCEQEMKAANCEKFYQENPEAGKNPRHCEKQAVCLNHGKLQDYGGACLSGAGDSIKDFASGIYHFVVEDPKMSPNLSMREEFFKNCTTAECKRELLGPYVGLFSKEEIDGHPGDQKLNANDEANQVYLQGKSAKTLYRELMVKLQQKFKDKTMDEPFIEPWTGDAAEIKNPKSINEMIDGVLTKAGITNTACYSGEKLAEMRCYAFMTVVDPFMFAKGISVIGHMAGLASSTLSKAPKSWEAIKAMRAGTAKRASELATELKTYGSNSVYHRQAALRDQPNLVKTIDDANKLTINTKFPKQLKSPSELENLNWQEYAGLQRKDTSTLGAQYKALDPESKKQVLDVFNKMNDKHAYIDYVEKLNADAVIEIQKAGIPRELELLKNGKVSENATVRVLAKRAEARGQTNMSGMVKNDAGELVSPATLNNSKSELNLGPQVNRPFKNEKQNLTHLIQEDYVSDKVDQKFWNFLDTKQGKSFWTPLFDSTKQNSLTNPDFTKQVSKRYMRLN